MTWLGITDKDVQRFSTRGLGMDRQPSPVIERTDGNIMSRGTLLLEASMTGDSRPETLVGYDRNGLPAARSLSVKSIPGGGVTLVHAMGSALRHVTVQHGGQERATHMRITFAWDTARKWARLAVELPNETGVYASIIDDPLPMLVADLHELIMSRAFFSVNSVFAALSSEIEPIGPTPALSPQTPIAIPHGHARAGDLACGDVIVNDQGEQTQVLHTVRRRVPSKGSFRPIRLRAPYFGLRQDVVVAPTQRLIISGSEVEYMFNQEAVLIPASSLVNGTAAVSEPCGPVTEYVHVLLPRAQALRTAGCDLESLFVGRMRRKPQLLSASILAGLDRRTLPEHASPIHKVLGTFEAITLASQRAA